MECKEQLYLFMGKVKCPYNTPGGIIHIKHHALKG